MQSTKNKTLIFNFTLELFRDEPPQPFVPPIIRPERNDCEIIVVSKALT